MHLGIYWVALILLFPTCVVLAGWTTLTRLARQITNRRQQSPLGQEEEEEDSKGYSNGSSSSSEKDAEARRFRRTFLQVYLLVMGSEWLQSPYMYTLFRDERSFSESTVASLYATTYIGAAVSALFVGFLADRYGRRRACLTFCVLHSISCLTVLSSSLPLLYAGRVLAGAALTLLWTVFESWMVTEFNARDLAASSSLSLGGMFGVMTTSNCFSAIFGGVMGHCIVLTLGSRANPFLAGIFLEAMAAVLMLRNWNENYGSDGSSKPEIDDEDEQPTAGSRFGDIRLWILSFVSCFFEGTNFVILFFWPGMLLSAHGGNAEETSVPYGVIFATFMAAMILGALLFGALVGHHTNNNDDGSRSADRINRLGFAVPSLLLAAAIALASVAMVLLALLRSELGLFLGFLLFEVCNGIYIPSIAYQRGMIVADAKRTGTYGMMKIPLFIFVIWSLDMASLDDQRRRVALFVAAGMLLLAAISSAFLRPKPAAASAAATAVYHSAAVMDVEEEEEKKEVVL